MHKLSRSRAAHSVAISPDHVAQPATHPQAQAQAQAQAHALRPQCPCCAPQAEFTRPSQRLAERLAALRERQAAQPATPD